MKWLGSIFKVLFCDGYKGYKDTNKASFKKLMCYLGEEGKGIPHRHFFTLTCHYINIGTTGEETPFAKFMRIVCGQ